MNPEIADRLTKYLDTLEKGLDKAGDFIAEQAPLVVQELLAWRFWEAAMLAVVLALGVLLCIALWKPAKHFQIDDYDECGPLFARIILATTITVMTGFAIQNGIAAVKVKVAPRLIVLEEVRHLAK